MKPISPVFTKFECSSLGFWLEENDIDGAMSYLHAILKAGLRSPQAWSALGYCQFRQGRVDLALESYREAVKLDGGNSNAANGLGYLLADSGQDLDFAIELCRRAVERNPENLAYKDSLGWALFRAGKTLEAIGFLTEALSACPGDEVISGHLEAVRIHGKKKVSD